MCWKDKPSKIQSWGNDIDYAMFIDENGNESKISSIFKSIINNKPIDVNDRYFTITGCIFERSKYKKACENINKLKLKYWKNGFYFDTKYKKSKICMLSF